MWSDFNQTGDRYAARRYQLRGILSIGHRYAVNRTFHPVSDGVGMQELFEQSR
jgi:hypothetical protein